MDMDMEEEYQTDNLTLVEAVSMGTGVMIGAGIFALTGQVAQLAGKYFPFAFLAAAIVCGFSAYTYIKMSNAFPSAGGIATFLEKAYGRGTITAACGLLMAISMVVNESLVARTFGSYAAQLFSAPENSYLVPSLSVGLLLFAFAMNISGNRTVGGFALVTALVKTLGILVFALVGLWVADSISGPPSAGTSETTLMGFWAGIALAILAYKGFTTITNSGSEIVDPRRNVGRAIIISIAICVGIYTIVAFAVAANLTMPEIIAAKDFALAEAARPALGDYGLWFTVILAIIATSSGLIASVFAVSRMAAMLTSMKLIPHSHFGMPGTVQKHLVVYTVVIATVLTVFFDIGRIAALGAIFYLTMDIAVHWGVFRHLRKTVGANPIILIGAIVLDSAALGALLAIKSQTDLPILGISLVAIVLVFIAEFLYLRARKPEEADHSQMNH
jgi:amino acid transporter